LNVFDVLLSGRLVLDVLGNPARVADVAIRRSRIAEVATGLPDRSARRALDLDGAAVAPGFIDLHAHCDSTLWSDPIIKDGLIYVVAVRNGLYVHVRQSTSTAAEATMDLRIALLLGWGSTERMRPGEPRQTVRATLPLGSNGEPILAVLGRERAASENERASVPNPCPRRDLASRPGRAATRWHEKRPRALPLRRASVPAARRRHARAHA
jgi:predicted amidohydrolase YtcJ